MATHMLSEDDIALAAELVLGLLDPAETASARARMAIDPAFSGEVAAWEQRLMPMLEGAEAAPPEKIWHQIQSGITPATGQDNQQGRLRFWQGLSALSTVAALLLGVVALRQPDPPAAPAPVVQAPLMVAALGSDTSNMSMTASYDAQSGRLTLTPVSMDTGDLYPELWLIPADGKARSLGIVTRDRPSQIPVSANLRGLMGKGATLAITPEPEGGAPGGKATGPVIASGTITTI